jgi:hypothetical protein
MNGEGERDMTISKDEIERARLLGEYKYIVDTQSKVVQAKRGAKHFAPQTRCQTLFSTFSRHRFCAILPA